MRYGPEAVSAAASLQTHRVWASRARPKVLKDLMRHENLQTTLGYYADEDADEVADSVWQVFDELKQSEGNNNRNFHRKSVISDNAPE